MSSKRHTPEQIVAKLRQVDVLISQGSTAADAVRSIGVTEVILIESWRRHYNAVRPHASLGYRPPAPEVFLPAFGAWPAAQAGSASPAALPLAPAPALN
jgi:Integrase core domain